MKILNFKNIKNQKGSMLLEGLIGILIFSLGVLSLVGLQSVAVKNVTQAKYRSDAAYLADKFIAQMWVDNQSTLAADYRDGGPRYNIWLTSILNNKSLPGVTSAVNKPRVVMTPDTTTTSVTASVTLFWQLPGETTAHQYVTIAQIGK